jgi:hypothetical protein
MWVNASPGSLLDRLIPVRGPRAMLTRGFQFPRRSILARLAWRLASTRYYVRASGSKSLLYSWIA